MCVYAPCTIHTCTCNQPAKHNQHEVCNHVLAFVCSSMCLELSLTQVCQKCVTKTSTRFACTEHAEMLNGSATHNQPQPLESPKQLCGCHRHKVWSLPYHQRSSSLHLGLPSLHWWWYWHHHLEEKDISGMPEGTGRPEGTGIGMAWTVTGMDFLGCQAQEGQHTYTEQENGRAVQTRAKIGCNVSNSCATCIHCVLFNCLCHM